MKSVPRERSADEVSIVHRVLDHVLLNLPPHLQTTENLSLIARRLVDCCRAGERDERQLCRIAFDDIPFDRHGPSKAILPPVAGRHRLASRNSASDRSVRNGRKFDA